MGSLSRREDLRNFQKSDNWKKIVYQKKEWYKIRKALDSLEEWYCCWSAEGGGNHDKDVYEFIKNVLHNYSMIGRVIDISR